MLNTAEPPRLWREIIACAVLCAIVWPVVAVAAIGAWGLWWWVFPLAGGSPA